MRRGLLDAPGTVRGIAVEATWLATHVAFYPVGVVSEKLREPADRYTLEGLSPLRRGLLVGDIEAAGTPILLVHGLIDNRSIFTRLRRSLHRRGFGRVATVNLPLFTSDVPSAARRLAAVVETMCEQTGYVRLHIVAHSLGGLVARYYVQKLGGDARVHTLVTLGTPHEGTHLARLLPPMVPYTLLRQLRPDSDVIRELAGPAPGCRTRFVAFSGELDMVVRPTESALLHHPDLSVRNVCLPDVGHHSLPFNIEVVHQIATTLAHLDDTVEYIGIHKERQPESPAQPEAL
ncbi:alpha/beta fold hydrolase [Frankia sp. Cppng1_Ct_nod]|uniref:esterase/lipase family protein n=1 Tax=Frankia sp. Cppng1_Ct_nod TaxID=2897162 RepID=UPI0020241F69|nr:alpha/beta fold hydrolase [Frankia sp. Cppng1_Ct_nod]